MISKFFIKFHNTFFLNKQQKEFYNFFDSSIKKPIQKSNVLVEAIEDMSYYALFGLIINNLKKSQEISVDQYIPRSLTLGSLRNISSFLKSIFFNNWMRDYKWIRLYSSYCDNLAYRQESGINIIKNGILLYKAYKIFKEIKTKDDVINLIIEEVKVGDLIYDSYLRFKPSPTVNVNDIYLLIVLWQAMRNIYLAKQYFQLNDIKVFLTTYSTYIQHGIAVRVALEYGVNVYSFGNYQNFAKQLKVNDSYHTASYSNYKENFNKLEWKEKEKALDKAKKALINRLSGKIDTATSYMKKSAYIDSNEEVPDYIKGAIIIFLHDFFDSPHIYGNMIFPDFLEWIEFTVNICEKMNIPYVLKEHPNQINDSKQVVQNLKKKYPKIRFISSKITNKQLYDAGISIGITVYGSVAHELVYLGVPVITCAQNPHSSYSFCYEAHTKNEYESLLKSYKSLSIIKNIKTEVESFYYMHNLNTTIEMQYLIQLMIKLLQSDLQVDINWELLYDIENNVAFKNFCKRRIRLITEYP